jgi:tetratricopeptide (TPR) repeat protein
VKCGLRPTRRLDDRRWKSDGLGKWSALSESLLGRIFISYRRQETAWPAGRLYDVLVEHFAAEQVFKDVDNIEPGEDFVERIAAAVGSCDVLLVLIGPQWLTITDENGQHRLDNPEDYVRLEIEAALKRKIRVIPILVDDALMPRANQLPASLAALVRRNAVEINPLTFDTKRLMATVHKTLAELKVPDTSTGSESPTSTPGPDRSNQQVAEPEVEQLYDRALAAFWTERWDEAVDLLGEVLSRQPDYPDAARKLELARRQQQVALHYAEGSAAADVGDWEQAVAEYTMIADTDPDYRDTNARLANARHQQRLASLQAEARRLHHAGQWAAVIKVGEQLQAIDPAAADPDRLITSARAELAAEQQAARLAADYRTGLRLIDAGRWKEAVETLERVTLVDSTYQGASALLDRARRELQQAAVLAEEQARRRPEEQARRQPDEQTRRQPEEQTRRQPEEQARRQAVEQARRQPEEQARRQPEEQARGQEKHQPPPKPSARKPVPTGSAFVPGEVGRHATPAEGKRQPDQTKSPHKQAGLLSRWVQIIVGVQGPPDQREPTKESRAASIPPAAPGRPAGEQPPADQTKPPDKLSDGLSRRGRLITIGVVVAAVALLVGLAGMIDFNPDVDTEPPAPTETVANTSPHADEIVFQDDFANRSNGWDDAGSARAGGHYKDGAYLVYAEPTGQGSTKGGAPRNASNMYPTAPPNLAIEVDAKALAIPEGTAYGIGCRMADNGGVLSGYLFMLGNDYVDIFKYGVDGTYRQLKDGALPSAFKVNSTNRLEATCSGGEGDQAVSLVFKVNGQVAAQATDSKDPLTTGTVALLAEAYEDSKTAVEVQFDNLVVQA